MKLTYQPLPDDDVIRVACEGTVSLRGLTPPADPLQDLLGPHCYRHRVILNLERADAMDTSGLAWLIGLVGRFDQSSGQLVPYGAAPAVRQMLDVLGLADDVPIATTEPLALGLIARRAGDDASGNGHPRAPRAAGP